MPQPVLRRSQALIRTFCEEHDLPYHQTGLVDSYVRALRYLHALGRPVQTGPVREVPRTRLAGVAWW